MKRTIILLTAIAMLCGCSSRTVQQNAPQTAETERQSAEPAAETAEQSAEITATEELPETPGTQEGDELPAPWSKSDYPELKLSDLPEYGEAGVKMLLTTSVLDDGCMFLLADDATADGNLIRCTSLKLGLTVSGTEQDIVTVPAELTAPGGSIVIDPDTIGEQMTCSAEFEAEYTLFSFSEDSAYSCAYYTAATDDAPDAPVKHFRIKLLGFRDERNALPEASLTLPPEQRTGEYIFSTCPAVVSCIAPSQQEALDILAEKYFASLMGDDPCRSFKVTEYRNIHTEILGRTTEAPDIPYGVYHLWDTLDSWEISDDSWLVNISAEFRGEGHVPDLAIELDPEEWYSTPYGVAPPRYFLMYSDGETWYLWSRCAYFRQ